MLPNLVVIGAAKCGTTSLHYYLGRHPEIAMSRPKELEFFSRPDWRERIDWYGSQFPDDRPVRGEASGAYTQHPVVAGVPERMRELIPEARLVYLVGDPIRRLVGHYVQNRYRRRERRPFVEALGAIDDPSSFYVAGSRYATQLERYLACFPAVQILVVDQDDLRHRRQQTLRSVFRFAGVEDTFASPAFGLELNPRAELRSGLYRAVRHPAVARVVPRGVRGRLRGHVPRAIGRPLPAPDVDPALRARLEGVLRAETDRLRALTGKRFAGWSV